MTIAVAPTTIAGGVKNAPYSTTFSASGGTGPYTFAVTTGTLPTGLTLNGGTGVLSGTPTTAGTYSFTIRATDSLSATDSRAYTVYVSGALYWFICTSASYPSAIPVVSGSQPAFNRAAANAIAGLSSTRHGVGDFLARPNANAVNNHLLCDGSAVGRTAFPQLFAEIGIEWGPGDGLTTFNIPNLVGATIPNAVSAPAQTISDGTVSTGATIVQPGNPGQSGGSFGGNVVSGGRTRTVETP